MKKLTYLVCFSLLTLTGCHQEEEINDLNFKSTENEKAFKQFYTKSEPLMPTGDSTLDTENLQAAIHGLGPRSVLPDRALLPRRGSEKRPSAGVHTGGHRGVIRRRGIRLFID